MADVFISYKREDRIWAERIAAALAAAGYTTWWDTSLIAGEHFNEAIDRELDAARCVVVIWSATARASRWVQAEAISGFERGILVAARLDDVRLGYPFEVVQTLLLRDVGDLTGILDGVRGKLDGAQPPVRPARQSRDRGWIGAINRTQILRWAAIAFAALIAFAGNGFGVSGLFVAAWYGLPPILGFGFFDRGLGRRGGFWMSLAAVSVASLAGLGAFSGIIFLAGDGNFVRGFGRDWDIPAMAAGLAVYAGFCFLLGRVLRRFSWA